MNDVKTPKEIFEDKVAENEVSQITLASVAFPHSQILYRKYNEVLGSAGYFIGPPFTENCVLEYCYFENSLVLTNQSFEKFLSFENSAFNQAFIATSLQAKAEVHFNNIITGRKTEFWGCTFESRCSFKGSEFRGDFSFEKCTFRGDLDFSNVKFNSLATFLACVFEGKVIFEEANFKHIHIENCTFKQRVDFSSRQERKTIPQITIHNTNFNEEVVFCSRTFKKANFHAVTFNGVADFYDTCFEQPVNFAKTKFLDTCSFVKTRFEGIAVFNLAVIGRNIVLRDACFEQGVNLATLDFVGEGTINSFGVNIKPFTADKDAQDINLHDNWKKISQQHLRETYRILKHESIKQNNRIQALAYHAREMEAHVLVSKEKSKAIFYIQNPIPEKILFQDLISRICLNGKSGIRDSLWAFPLILYAVVFPFSYLVVIIFRMIGVNQDLLLTRVNQFTNEHGQNWKRGIVVTLLTAFIFFIFYLCSLQNFSIRNLGSFVSDYSQFLNPVHSFTFMTPKEGTVKLGDWSIFIDSIARILIGICIYQTIQAFRKYGRF